MDPISVFAAGAVIYTGLNFIPQRKPTFDDLILNTWKQSGLANKDGLLPEKKKGAWFLPAGLSPKDVEKTLPALCYQLNGHVEMEVRGKGIYLHIYPGQLPSMVPYHPQDLSDYSLGIVLGKTHKKECLTLDLDDSCPYILTAGGVGMGKSNWINLVLGQLNQAYGPDRLQYYLVDLKLGVELKKWSSSELCGGFCWDPKGPQIHKLLAHLSKEIKRRMTLFGNLGFDKIDDYNAQADERLPYLLLVIDEYAELFRLKEAEEKLQHLLQIGRAAGLRCLIATQRPTHDLISTSIKALIPTRLCFSVADDTNSKVVIDRSGAEDLGGIKGRALLLHGASVQPVQIMMSSTPFRPVII